ncbi:uncharacterized protein LOC144984635 isoform X2 [Oryzias latipes]
MEVSEPDSLHVRGSTAVSLNQRFSQVLMEQLTRSSTAAQPPVRLRGRRRGVFRLLRVGVAQGTAPLLLLTKRRRRRRRSVWTRLGRTHMPCRTPGFWSFRNKYRWGARWGPSFRRRRKSSLVVQRGGATSARGRFFWRNQIPTKKQLDAQLDQYMSLSRSRLDQELEDYMSLSRSRLDAQLEEYMLMAGQSHMD